MMKNLNLLGLLVVFVTLFTSSYANPYGINYDSNGGEYFAVMTSGDISDFGYNYIINAGRVAMEAKLNMTNTLFVPNILDNVSAIAKAKELVQSGYRVIVSGTFSHGNAMYYMATQYSNVSFVAYTSSKYGLPNLSSASWLNAEFWFAIGVFAGATTINDKVGFIHPGKTEGSIQSINAFYSGVKYANKSLQVYTMYTGAYIAEDRAAGASDYLLNTVKVGALTGQQDDLTVPIAAMDAGLLGIGVTGFSLRTLYGELVGVSFVRDWTAVLSNYSAGVSGSVYKNDITSSFKTGGQYTDKTSYLVTTEEMAVVDGAINTMKTSYSTLYYCGDWFQAFPGWNTTTRNCLNGSTFFNTQVYPDIHDLGYYTVPVTDRPFPTSTRIGIIVTAAILLLIPAALCVMVVYLRKHPEIQAGSPFFFLVMLVGCILVYLGVIVWPLSPSVNNCYARIWLPSIGATIAISALITKNIRIFLLFFNPFKFRGEKLHIKYYIPFVAAMLVIDIAILIVYTEVGPKGVDVLQGTGDLSTYETRHVCATSEKGNSIIYAIFAYHMLQLVLGCIVSFLLRNVTEKQYNERKSVAMAIYVVTFCLVIIAILLGVTDISNVQLIVFISVALLIANTGALLIVFGSRFVNILTVPPSASVPKQGSKSSSGSRGGSGSGNSKGTSAGSDEYASANQMPSRTTAVVFEV